MASFAMSDTQEHLVQTAREFGRQVLEPAEVALDKIEVPDQAFAHPLFKKTMAAAYELGFHKMTLSQQFGGLGLDQSTAGPVWEELARYGAGFAAGLMASSVVPGLISFLAPDNKRLIERYVVPFCEDTSGTFVTAWGSSEPNVGSDGKEYDDLRVHHRTTAAPRDGSFVLDGTKSGFVSNGGIAKVYVVFACTDKRKGLRGSGMFVVPADAPGVTHGLVENRIGLRALNQASISLDAVSVPEDHLIFPPGDGYPILHHAIMTVGNLGTGYLALGVMRAAYEEALHYAKERVQGGKPIIEHQLVAKKLFDAHMAIESSRALLWKGSWHTSTNFPGDLKTSVTAKILATRNAVEHTTALLQVLGGYGITRDYKLEKYLRDSMLLPIMDGTNDTLMLQVMPLL